MVLEAGDKAPRGWVRCEIGRNIEFSTAGLETYFFSKWEVVLFDALVVAAAVEFCDRAVRRHSATWSREFELEIPVHDPARWSAAPVSGALHDALSFLTGDQWQIRFRRRIAAAQEPRQNQFELETEASAVIPFSEGLDSRAVSGLMARELGSALVRIRLGTKGFDDEKIAHRRRPFAAVPYKVRPGKLPFVESTARSRGFKFSLVSGLAAYLAKARRIVVPESGQGALGPVLVPVGQAHPDYRSHPLFTKRMETLLGALLATPVRFEFPRLWSTKGETLLKFVQECEESESWQATWSCWQQNRQVSVDKKKRQCGICAACLLRRLSIGAAGLREPQSTYVWERLAASRFEDGAAATFEKRKITEAMRQYAIAGVLHFDHLAALRHSPSANRSLSLHSQKLADAMSLQPMEVRSRLERFLMQHEAEWKGFIRAQGPDAFVATWAVHAR